MSLLCHCFFLVFFSAPTTTTQRVYALLSHCAYGVAHICTSIARTLLGVHFGNMIRARVEHFTNTFWRQHFSRVCPPIAGSPSAKCHKHYAGAPCMRAPSADVAMPEKGAENRSNGRHAPHGGDPSTSHKHCAQSVTHINTHLCSLKHEGPTTAHTTMCE